MRGDEPVRDATAFFGSFALIILVVLVVIRLLETIFGPSIPWAVQ